MFFKRSQDKKKNNFPFHIPSSSSTSLASSASSGSTSATSGASFGPNPSHVPATASASTSSGHTSAPTAFASSSPPEPHFQAGENKKRTPTDSSYYSCTGLPPSEPSRYIKASEARRQMDEIPQKKPRVQRPNATSHKKPLAEYPKNFKNTEKLDDLTVKRPWQEYPILPQGKWDPESINQKHAARAIFRNGDRSKFDLAYHDPRKGPEHHKNLSLADYRPAVATTAPKA